MICERNCIDTREKLWVLGISEKRSRAIHLVVPSKKTYELLHKLSTSISDINPQKNQINIISGKSNIHSSVDNILWPLWKTKVSPFSPRLQQKRIDYQKHNKRRSKSNLNKLNNQVFGIVLDTCIFHNIFLWHRLKENQLKYFTKSIRLSITKITNRP